MLRLAAEENFNAQIVRGLLRPSPELDIVRIQDAGLSGADDPTVLGWAADEARVVLSHDVSTMTRWAIERISAGEPMPGLVEVSIRAPIGTVIEDVLFLATAGLPSDCAQRILYIPL
jgi:hypothetical protein